MKSNGVGYGFAAQRAMQGLTDGGRAPKWNGRWSARTELAVAPVAEAGTFELAAYLRMLDEIAKGRKS